MSRTVDRTSHSEALHASHQWSKATFRATRHVGIWLSPSLTWNFRWAQAITAWMALTGGLSIASSGRAAVAVSWQGYHRAHTVLEGLPPDPRVWCLHGGVSGSPHQVMLPPGNWRVLWGVQRPAPPRAPHQPQGSCAPSPLLWAAAFLSTDFPFYLVVRVVTAAVDIWCSSHPDGADERASGWPGALFTSPTSLRQPPF